MLRYKEDWAQTQERYMAWWDHEYFGRCALAVTARRAGAPEEPCPKGPEEPERMWTDLEYWGRRMEWGFRRTFYGGEAFPVWNCGYPGHLTLWTFLGCPIRFMPETAWVDPILVEEGLDVSRLRLDPRNRWWRLALQALEYGAAQCRGKALLSLGAFGGCGDTLGGLRGNQRLLLDVADRPDEVRAAEEQMLDLWIETYQRFQAIAATACTGTTCWFGLWSPGRFYATHNDFAYMISPRMFRELFLPALERQVGFLTHAVHHLDGVGNFRHLDTLCELPGLQAIQILPGAGKPSPLHYLEALRKVQAAGKNLHISIPAREVRAALDLLSARGLFIQTSCEGEAEARSLLKDAERWSRDRG